jgi:ABC-type transporter Mla subunit MlaD
MNKKYIFYGLIIVILLHYIFYLLGTIKITARFHELEPFRHNVSVYYKGFRLGKTTKVHPGEDYQTTLIDMRIKDKGIKLPANTEIILRRKDKKDYIELVYPNTPYIESLKHGAVLDGHLGVNFENFIEEQARNGGLDEIKENVNTTVISAGQTFDALTDMLNVMTGILEDVRPAINDTVNNVNIASENLAKVSISLKQSVDKGYIDSTLFNIQETSENLVFTTKNFGGLSKSLNHESAFLANCLLQKLNLLASNLNQIAIGIGETLKKRFGGIRLFLGKAID